MTETKDRRDQISVPLSADLRRALSAPGKRQGTVKSFSQATLYGFILDDDRYYPDGVLFHANGCRCAPTDLSCGTRVSFSIDERSGRPRAAEVRLV
jgi:cold shock CspA family protein